MSITIAEIHRSIHGGARGANKKYTKWSKGLWLNDSGVESLLVCEIAERLYQAQSDTERLWLELSFGNILDLFEVRNRREINIHQRVDIALLDRNKRPKFIVEVKREWNNNYVRNDLDKIKNLVQNCPLSRGFLAVFMAHRVAHQDMQRRIEDGTNFAKNYGVENNISVHITEDKIYESEDKDGRLWQSSSLSIEMSTRR